MERTGEALQRSLSVALREGGSPEWELFIRNAHPVIAAAAFRSLARWGPPQKDQVDDLVQETFLKLCRQDFHLLRSFRSESPEALIAYLRAVTSALAADTQRARLAIKRGAGKAGANLDESEAHGSEKSIDQVERQILYQQIDRCLATQLERDRQIFWLYYRHGLTSKAIAAIKVVDLTTSGVESLIRRLTIGVRKCLGAPPGQKIDIPKGDWR